MYATYEDIEVGDRVRMVTVKVDHVVDKVDGVITEKVHDPDGDHELRVLRDGVTVGNGWRYLYDISNRYSDETRTWEIIGTAVPQVGDTIRISTNHVVEGVVTEINKGCARINGKWHRLNTGDDLNRTIEIIERESDKLPDWQAGDIVTWHGEVRVRQAHGTWLDSEGRFAATQEYVDEAMGDSYKTVVRGGKAV